MKEEILRIFKGNKGNFISGESLSSLLNVSRAAIWKYINLLKSEGYIFESSSKVGYKLVGEPDLLTRDELSGYLDTAYIGRNLVHFDTIPSTNTKAKELANEGAVEGTLIVAEEQTAGKGRLGRTWVSPKHKGIWMSLILKPDLNPIFASKITLIGASAVFKALEENGIISGIKWPNDIVIGGRKVCGILTEMSAELNKIHYLVIGIGINVNTEEIDFPRELHSTATSLKIETGKRVERKILAAGIMNNFEVFYKEFKDKGSLNCVLDICKRNSVLLGKEIRLIKGDSEITAKAVDIDEEGQLVIEHSNGSTEAVFSGEVSARGLYGYI